MVEEWVDVEYLSLSLSLSLSQYIRNAPSDTEVRAEHQVRVERST